MAVTLRLARHGTRSKPYYRIVAADKTFKRDGRFLEIVGTYHPLFNPVKVTLKEERIKHWVEHGATATQKVHTLIVKAIPGLLEKREEHKLAKIREQRQKRKARAKAKGQGKTKKK